MNDIATVRRTGQECPYCGAYLRGSYASHIRANHDKSYTVPHGTNGGYQLHQKRGQKPCDECRAAHAEYQATYRRNRGLISAEKRATEALVENHRAEFDRLLAEESA